MEGDGTPQIAVRADGSIAREVALKLPTFTRLRQDPWEEYWTLKQRLPRN